MATPPMPGRLAPPISAQLQQAIAHHQAGRLELAGPLYRQVLAQVPKQFDATHLLGVVALQQGRLDDAESLIREALSVNPKDVGALNNLGTTLLRAGRLDGACTQFERVLKAKPTHLDALTNFGTVLRQLGRAAEAIGPLRKAFAANPRSPSLCGLLGASLLETGDARGALPVFEAGVKAAPRDAAAWVNLAHAALAGAQPARALEAADTALALDGSSAGACSQRGLALAALGRHDEARAAFTTGTQRAPNDAASHNNLGAFLRDQGEFDAAIASLKRATELDPALLAAQENLVNALIAAGHTDRALARSRAMVERHPQSALALAALAAVQFDQDQLDAAIDTYTRAVGASDVTAEVVRAYGNALMANGEGVEAQRQYARALELGPNDAKTRWAQAIGAVRPIYATQSELEEARRAFARAIGDLQSWFTPARTVTGAAAVGSTQPFYLAYHAEDNRPLLAPYGSLCSRLMAAAHPVLTPTPAPSAERRLRVGFVSAQVRNHSVWNAITRGWIKHLDPTGFETWVFHLGRQVDGETAWARQHAAHFIDAPRNLRSWIEAISRAQLDVLIYPEIGMDPLTLQLASLRLAPVQAASWGHPQTTGLTTLDLYLSADAMEPAAAGEHYTERLKRLPRLGVCVDALAPPTAALDLTTLGLPTDEPLLLCPGTPFKYTPAHDAVWVDLGRRLQTLGRGRLVFFRSHRSAMTEQLKGRLGRAFASGGVDPARLLCWIPTLERSSFFGLMQRAALMLDTPGFSGFNTALQALECGLPVVAHEGRFLRGRLASGPLRLMGLDDWVATSDAEYVDKAMRLAGSEPLRLTVRQQIAQRRGALFGDLSAVRGLEQVLRDSVARATS